MVNKPSLVASVGSQTAWQWLMMALFLSPMSVQAASRSYILTVIPKSF
jgi:hypothetical protein